MAGWYRRFVPNYAQIAAPINALMKGKHKSNSIRWTNEAKTAFHKLKKLLATSPILGSADVSLPFVITTDASNYGVGAVLSQQDPVGEKAVAYCSRSLNSAERNYSVTERECKCT